MFTCAPDAAAISVMAGPCTPFNPPPHWPIAGQLKEGVTEPSCQSRLSNWLWFKWKFTEIHHYSCMFEIQTFTYHSIPIHSNVCQIWLHLKGNCQRKQWKLVQYFQPSEGFECPTHFGLSHDWLLFILHSRCLKTNGIYSMKFIICGKVFLCNPHFPELAAKRENLFENI